MRKYVSFDIGGTDIKYALIDENANIIEKYKIATEAYKGGRTILEKVINIVKEFKNKEEISGVAISTAGMVDVETGEIFYSSTIPNYIGINFKKEIEEKLNLPCKVENDVNCAGLAEYISGVSKGSKIAVMITVGTGIGGSIIINGEMLHGFSNSAGEVAYMNIDGENFQDIASTRALLEEVANKKQENIENWSGKRVFEEAKNGDEICSNAIDKMVDILGKGIANICCVVNPEVVVLGGGIMEQEAYLKSKIEKSLKKYLVAPIEKHTEIRFAKHKNDAGILGAFYNLLSKKNYVD